jgi:hypothetical protein
LALFLVLLLFGIAMAVASILSWVVVTPSMQVVVFRQM